MFKSLQFVKFLVGYASEVITHRIIQLIVKICQAHRCEHQYSRTHFVAQLQFLTMKEVLSYTFWTDQDAVSNMSYILFSRYVFLGFGL